MAAKQIILFHFFLISSAFLSAQTVPIGGPWKFHTGDDPAWKEENFDDRNWPEIRVPGNWEAGGYQEYDGFGWYRTTFTLPESLLQEAFVLMLGAIDDVDETYLNGVRVGSTGKFPPGDQSAWDTPRKYLLPPGILKSRNTLAIRVYDGAGGGGIYQGPVELIPKKLYDQAQEEKRKNRRSYQQLTTSNGLVTAVYNAISGRVENVYPHIFSAYDSADFVEPYAFQVYPDIPELPVSVKYLKNTHVIEATYAHFVIDYFASFSKADQVLYAVVRGDAARISNIRFKMEGTGGTTSCFRQRSTGKQSEIYFLFRPKSGQDIREELNRIKAMPVSLVDTEVQYMQQVFARCRFPKKIRRAERDLLEQSVSVLKMAQVADQSEFPLAKGQILASLRPGVWAISWVRDAAFAIGALTKIGLYEEARKGLEFMLRAAPTNQYKQYIHNDGKDYGIGVDYQISVTRYFGNGREESDFDRRGPNIELDDFGLFLIALCDYVNSSGDSGFYKKWQNVLQSKVADAIVHNIDARDIIRADSGPWEHHLPGRPFTFTSGVCCVGLEKFAALQQANGLESAAYFTAAKRLRKGMMTHMLYENRLLKGNAEDQSPDDHYFFDAATFELFANGFVTDKALFLSHMAAYDTQLRVKTGKKMGYIRFNSSDSYENQEWPFAGLRVAAAQAKFGRKKEAKALVARVTEIAVHNFHLIPEILTLEEEAYKGSIPMAGYGAGAYILAIWALANGDK